MLVVLHLLTRRLLAVPFESGRLAGAVAISSGVAVLGELLLPTEGATGFVTRALALVAIPLLLAAVRFPRPGELAGARRALSRR